MFAPSDVHCACLALQGTGLPGHLPTLSILLCPPLAVRLFPGHQGLAHSHGDCTHCAYIGCTFMVIEGETWEADQCLAQSFFDT